jgi:A/G-specific adenine glycosylase
MASNDSRPGDPATALIAAVRAWYAGEQRDLPWRRPDASPWAILVSEVMLQQTPVSRVLPAYERWLARWPTPAALASSPAGDAVRAWARLGYPRRALALHGAASAIVERHGGQVPADPIALRALPGVGEYTAAAVAAFAFGQRHAVLDTNVRRVLARALHATHDAGPSVTVAERAAALAVLPDDGRDAALASVALMELGALVCRAREPRCGECPLAAGCAWRAAGMPGPLARTHPRRSQKYAGTDRQARGRLLGVVRDGEHPVARSDLLAAWPDAAQAERALQGLLADGLLTDVPGGRLALPG